MPIKLIAVTTVFVAVLATSSVLADAKPETPEPSDAGRRVIERKVGSRTFQSIQVNVNGEGNDIPGDAANGPSIAVDPTDHRKMVIVWRQFNSISSNFRQAACATSRDGGRTWTTPHLMAHGTIRDDPVLAAGANSDFYHASSSGLAAELFKSTDGGVTWRAPVFVFCGPKPWITVDQGKGIGAGNVYLIGEAQHEGRANTSFARSTRGGVLFGQPIAVPTPGMKWSTADVGHDGTLYLAGTTPDGTGHVVARSSDAKYRDQEPTFDLVQKVGLGGRSVDSAGPNPGGLLGRVWIAGGGSEGKRAGEVYMLASVDPPGDDPLDVMFIRSTDRGKTWSKPVRVNDDPAGGKAWQWFGTMSVAPNGRIDVIWNDTRNAVAKNGEGGSCEVYYASSTDGGVSWSKNIPISLPFDSFVGWPNQNKLGDSYHMVSDNAGANLAYAATFNRGQDVYFVRIEP